MNFIDKIVERKIINKMGTTIKLSNFGKQNTPAITQIIGDIALVCSFVTSIPLLMSSQGMAIPHWAVVASGIATSVAGAVKILTKTVGTPDEPAANSQPLNN